MVPFLLRQRAELGQRPALRVEVEVGGALVDLLVAVSAEALDWLVAGPSALKSNAR